MQLVTIQTGKTITLDNIEVEIIKYLGVLNNQIHYYQVKVVKAEKLTLNQSLGLLRIGDIESNLSHEIKLRNQLNNYGMISDLWANITLENVIINLSNPEENYFLNLYSDLKVKENSLLTNSQNLEIIDNQEDENKEEKDDELTKDFIINEKDNHHHELKKKKIEDNYLKEDGKIEDDYLEEEYYPEIEVTNQESSTKLLILTPYPPEKNTLTHWLTQSHSDEEKLSLLVILCQGFFYLSQNGWYSLNLSPDYISIETPIKLYDLTCIYPQEIVLNTGLLGNYCPPELSYSKEINQFMSSYVIGSLMYQMFHNNQLPNTQNLTFNLIPRIYQILQISLSPIPEERYSLNQLLQILIETRNALRHKTISWQILKKSILGLSQKRLVNEDSYGIKEQEINQNNIVIAGIADGMGGMVDGELASKLAIQTLLKTPIDFDLNSQESQQKWLIEIFNQANKNINQQVKDGGTTLSVILGINNQLMISHVGDSRIYLITNGEIKQLSEDHSLVNMMLASGQITEEESINHPDRNVLIKSLGSKSVLTSGYVQDLSKNNDKISLILENNDLLILCTDGVWDYFTNQQFLDIFNQENNLDLAINKIITQVLNEGASDNATILVLKCSIESYKF
ncbi:PP2C family serine/threonine-protein phosphatase [Geminocystis sp. NIES-3709]|uniref:PP2C family protein-serine/threonine phosphatase n=1 Tax=Geminocystis sp. NIES-3709 TaxID=1617448 RepID=UPI0005FC628E|nr:protein phosphatase 2C domain-containing protein [Geminocystis sp. NIES-3709]BAQ64813.1 protein serine/threonine phosphatase PrpC [Geminocystis sp. NIES-3709]